jgi:hypothetical protein
MVLGSPFHLNSLRHPAERALSDLSAFRMNKLRFFNLPRAPDSDPCIPGLFGIFDVRLLACLKEDLRLRGWRHICFNRSSMGLNLVYERVWESFGTSNHHPPRSTETVRAVVISSLQLSFHGKSTSVPNDLH